MFVFALFLALTPHVSGDDTEVIDLSGNYVSSTGVIDLSDDLTSGANPLIAIENVESNADYKQVLLYNSEFSSGHLLDAETSIAGGAAPYTISLGSYFQNSILPITVTEAVTVTFSDPLINDGALTEGSLEVTAITGPSSEEIDLGTLTYTATPEPSTWAMLLGGLGLLAVWHRRKLKA